MSFETATFTQILDDLSSRFIINVPEEELSSIERICFQIEQAHWFYEDFVREQNPSLPSFTLKVFSARFFDHCPLLFKWRNEHEKAFGDFMKYKIRVPVCGAIMLNSTMDKVLLVKGWSSRSGWGFPKGKINKDELDSICAAREVFEETGYDITPLIKEKDFVEITIRGQRIRLYIVVGVLEATEFCPQTRKEISKIEWHNLSDLPTWSKNRNKESPFNCGGGCVKYGSSRYYMVVPFVTRLRKWVLARNNPKRKNKNNNANNSNKAGRSNNVNVGKKKSYPLDDSNNINDNTKSSYVSEIIYSESEEIEEDDDDEEGLDFIDDNDNDNHVEDEDDNNYNNNSRKGKAKADLYYTKKSKSKPATSTRNTTISSSSNTSEKPKYELIDVNTKLNLRFRPIRIYLPSHSFVDKKDHSLKDNFANNDDDDNNTNNDNNNNYTTTNNNLNINDKPEYKLIEVNTKLNLKPISIKVDLGNNINNTITAANDNSSRSNSSSSNDSSSTNSSSSSSNSSSNNNVSVPISVQPNRRILIAKLDPDQSSFNHNAPVGPYEPAIFDYNKRINVTNQNNNTTTRTTISIDDKVLVPSLIDNDLETQRKNSLLSILQPTKSIASSSSNAAAVINKQLENHNKNIEYIHQINSSSNSNPLYNKILQSPSLYNNNNNINSYYNNNIYYNNNNHALLLNPMTTPHPIQDTSANNALYEEIKAQERQLLDWITTQI